jgi:cytochrome c oxidase subunit 2
MHFLGFSGMPRRIPDFPDAYSDWNAIASFGSWLCVISTIVFFVGTFRSLFFQKSIIIDPNTNRSHWTYTNESLDTSKYLIKPFVKTLYKSNTSEFTNNKNYVEALLSKILVVNNIKSNTSKSILDANLLSNNFFDAATPWQIGFQDPATSVMNGVIDLHHDIFYFLVVILTIVTWFLVVINKTFQQSNDIIYTNRIPVKITYHTNIEIIWTLIPCLVLFIMAIPSFTLLYSIDTMIDPRITLKVTGSQWYWNYEYSDFSNLNFNNKEIIFDSYLVAEEDLLKGMFRLLDTDTKVHLPIKTNIRLLITSSDVLHSWAVPSLGVKLDACPGRLNQVSLYINREGRFYGQCSEICGINHGFMPITILASDFA